MAYADTAYAVTLYGQAYVNQACDRNLDGTLDASSFEAHLELASARIDAALRGRIALPLVEPVDPVVKQTVVDIAVYNCSPTADVLTTEIKARYEQACTFLHDVAMNRARISAGPSPVGDAVNASAQPSLTTERASACVLLTEGSRSFSSRLTGTLT